MSSTKAKKKLAAKSTPPSPKGLAVMARLAASATPLPLSSSLRPR